jgi:hypothetical protein
MFHTFLLSFRSHDPDNNHSINVLVPPFHSSCHDFSINLNYNHKKNYETDKETTNLLTNLYVSKHKNGPYTNIIEFHVKYNVIFVGIWLWALAHGPI